MPRAGEAVTGPGPAFAGRGLKATARTIGAIIVDRFKLGIIATGKLYSARLDEATVAIWPPIPAIFQQMRLFINLRQRTYPVELELLIGPGVARPADDVGIHRDTAAANVPAIFKVHRLV